MKAMKKFLAIVLTLCALTSVLSGCGSKEAADDSKEDVEVSTTDFEPVVWKLSHGRNPDSRAGKAIQKFADDVAAGTDGKVKIEIYPNSSLGDYETVQERVSMNDVQMQMSDMSTKVDPSLIVPTIPYLIGTWDDVEKYTTVENGGVLIDFMQERLAEQNITLLNNYPQYFASICSTKEIKNYEDPTAPKGLKMRVPTSTPFEKLGNLFGFTSTPMASNECYTSMQTGVIDGMIGGGTEYYYENLRELVNYILPVNTHYVCYWIVVNSDAYNSLPAEYQEVITAALAELHTKGLEDAKAEGTSYEEKFAAQGATIYELTDDQINAYANAYREEVWPQLGTDILGDAGLAVLKEMAAEYGINF